MLFSQTSHSGSGWPIKNCFIYRLTNNIFGIQFIVETFVSSFDHHVLSDYNKADRIKEDIDHYIYV